MSIKKLLPLTSFEKTELIVSVNTKDKSLILENLDLYNKELVDLRKTYKDKIIRDNKNIVTNMVSHYYFHDERYLFENIGRSPRIIDAAIKVSGYLFKNNITFTTNETMKFKRGMDEMIEAYNYFISTIIKIHNELNAVFDIINNEEETYTKTQMVNYTMELNKLIDSGKLIDKDTIGILKQFNDIRNMVLHEDARLFSFTFKVDEIRAIINCIRLCKVILKRLIMEYFPNISKAIDLNIFSNNQKLMLKSGFVKE